MKGKKELLYSGIKKILAPLITSALCACIFILIPKLSFLKPWLGLIMESTPEWYVNTYYNVVNPYTKAEEFPDIVILDLNDKISRSDLADIIKIVAESSPKSIGVDCTFSTSDSYDSIQTAYLINSLAQLSKNLPIVYAVKLRENSAIPDSLMYHKGFVNFKSSVIYNYQPYKGTFPHLSLEMAHLAGYDVSQIDTNSFMVNYRNKEFFSIPIYSDFRDSDYTATIREDVENKIVLIGGLNNRLDKRTIPFYIDSGSEYISGTKIIAYMLSSIISASSPDNYRKQPTFHHYSRCSWWMNLLLTILFAIVYLGIYIWIDKAQQQKQWIVLLKPCLLFVMMMLIVIISIIITATCYQIPYVVYFMVMTVFLGFSYDIFKKPLQSFTPLNETTVPQRVGNVRKKKKR